MALDLPSSLECAMVGVVRHDKVGQLCDQLKVLSYFPAELVTLHELVYVLPKGAAKLGSVVRLRKSLLSDKSPTHSRHSWVVRHEGGAMRGQAASDLPATVREVLQSRCEGNGAPRFWLSIGLKLEHTLVRDGNWYRIHYQHQDLEVMVVRIKKMADPRRPENATDLTPGFFLVEVSCKTDAEDHVEAANAVGAFSERLLPYVDLGKTHVSHPVP